MIEKCNRCKKPYDWKELETFNVEERTCAITESIKIGDRLILMCKDCLEEVGKPISVYVGTIHYEKEWKLGIKS